LGQPSETKPIFIYLSIREKLIIKKHTYLLYHSRQAVSTALGDKKAKKSLDFY